MDLGLRGRVFVLTGASRGLGRAVAAALVAEEAKVVLGARSPERTAKELGAVPVVADNGDPKTPGRLVAAARENFGRLDGALISVGGPPAGHTSAVTEQQWRAAFETVFLGTVRLTRAVADALVEGGSIVIVLSSSVRTPIPGLALSNGLRPGLAGFAKTLADEVGPRGVRVNGILPGKISTERVREIDAASGADPKAVAKQIPLRRYGLPEEVGRVAMFLLSPAASYVTGTMLPVDGGALRAL